MHSATRLLALRFDAITRRYIGEVLLVGPDGSERTVSSAVHGMPGLPLERVARKLIGAARLA
jgi:hypothetical protein